MTVFKIYEKIHMTNYHRLDIGLRAGDSVLFEEPDHDISIFDTVTTLCLYSLDLKDSRCPQPSANGKISVLKHLKNLNEFSWWGVDASEFDWRGFEDLKLGSAKINDYLNLSNPMILPSSLQHLSFSGIEMDPYSPQNKQFFDKMYRDVPMTLNRYI